MAEKSISLRALCIVLVVAAFAFCMFAGCAGTPETVTLMRDESVLVLEHTTETGDTVSGTGFVIASDDGQTYAVTNYHVIMDADSVTVKYSGGNSSASLVGYYEYHDIAIIRFASESEFTAIPGSAFTGAENGDSVWSIGNEHGAGSLIIDRGKTVSEETVVETERLGWYDRDDIPAGKCVPVAEYTCSIEGGMSGCPVVTEDGCVSGVGTYRTESSEHYYGVDSRIALEVYRAALAGDFCSAIGSPPYERGKEVDLAGTGNYYRIFLSENSGDYELVLYGNYYDWGERSESGGTVRRLHPLGLVLTPSDDGYFVSGTGSAMGDVAGKTLTAIGGASVADMGYADMMTLFYSSYRVGDGEENAVVLTFSDGTTVAYEGEGYSVSPIDIA